jgi:hypothetical protein
MGAGRDSNDVGDKIMRELERALDWVETETRPNYMNQELGWEEEPDVVLVSVNQTSYDGTTVEIDEVGSVDLEVVAELVPVVDSMEVQKRVDEDCFLQ